MKIPISINPPPENKIVILYFEDGSASVGYKRSDGVYFPSSKKFDVLAFFIEQPVSWQYLPE